MRPIWYLTHTRPCTRSSLTCNSCTAPLLLSAMHSTLPQWLLLRLQQQVHFLPAGCHRADLQLHSCFVQTTPILHLSLQVLLPRTPNPTHTQTKCQSFNTSLVPRPGLCTHATTHARTVSTHTTQLYSTLQRTRIHHQPPSQHTFMPCTCIMPTSNIIKHAPQPAAMPAASHDNLTSCS